MTQANLPQEHPDWDAYDDYTGPEPEHIIDDPTLPVTLHGHLTPINDEEYYVPNFQDGDGVVHFFAPADVSYTPEMDDLSHELRYFRVAETDDGRIVHDAHSVMPLERQGEYPFPRATLEYMLMHDELDSAIDLAHTTALSHGFAFPETLSPLDTGVRYDFAGGIEDDGSPALQAVKSWREGSVDREQRLTIANYGSAAALDDDLRELDEVRDGFGLQTAMNLAESMAVASGYLHDGRDDTRLFTEGPPDPFTTNAERERTAEVVIRDAGELDTEELPAVERAPMETDMYAQWAADAQRQRQANMPLEGAAWFEATFADNPEVELLQPLNDTVNYAVVVTDTDPWTTELMIEKFWREPGGFVGSDSLTIDTYDSDDEVQRDVAQAARATLLGVHEDRGLEALMHQAELGAMANGNLDGDRAGTRLFRDGPPDRFETLAHRVEGTDNPYWNTSGERIESPRDETQELPAVTPDRVYLLDEADMGQPAPDSWDALIAAQAEEEPAREAHYWQMHYRPVETAEGEPLGTALFVTEFPQLPPDFDDYIEANGMDDSVYPTEARTLEMAHFASEDDARKFEMEFRSYLVPGLLDGPELAPEVAKLEGLSGEWEELDYRSIVDYMSDDGKVVREAGEWRVHDSNAERDTETQTNIFGLDL